MPVLAYETNTHQIHTPVFDGPLELLLYLVRRRGVDIRVVHIAPITDAFLFHLKGMQELQLDIAGEFILLASTLCYLKSCELLPGLEREEENSEEDPIEIRDRLAQRLEEYERFRLLAVQLQEQPQLGIDTFTRDAPQTVQNQSIKIHTSALGLLEIYLQVLQQNALEPHKHEIQKEPFSLRKMGEWILDQLENAKRTQTPTTLQLFFSYYTYTSEKIICFLTILEMAKHQLIDVDQFEHLSEIHISPQFTERPELGSIFTNEDEE